MAGKSQSRSRKTDAVEDAAQARIEDDAPQVAGDDEGAAVGEAGGAGIAVAREFEGTDFELSEEQQADVIGQTSGDEDAPGLLGTIGDVGKGKPGDDLLGGGDGSDPPEAPFSGRPGAFEAGPNVREAGVFDLIDQPGAADSDPLSSFLGAVEAKLGRDLGLAPSDAQSDATPTGKDSISAGGNGITVTRGSELRTEAAGGKAIGDALGIETAAFGSSDYRQFIEVKDTNNGTITRVYDNGATTTTTLEGEKIDSTPGLTAPVVSTEPLPGAKTTQEIEEEKKKQEEEDKKKQEDKKDEGGGSKQPDEDHEFVVPEELQNQLNADAGRLRGLRNQGPDSGDGATDPSEIESEVVGVAGDLPTHAELGENLFGQPDLDADTGGGSNVNPGANNHGAGVITPGEDQKVATGPRRNDNPFDAAEPELVAVSDADAGSDASAESFLPPSEIDGPVDAPGDDVPEPLDLPT